MPIEFAARTRRIPVYPLAAGYDLGEDVAMLASNESYFAPLPSVVEAAGRAMAGAHRYPDPSYS
ncbi:MAG: histidinol-phosphate transaminase, partial [Solirubrobacteraceae bacterium]